MFHAQHRVISVTPMRPTATTIRMWRQGGVVGSGVWPSIAMTRTPPLSSARHPVQRIQSASLHAVRGWYCHWPARRCCVCFAALHAGPGACLAVGWIEDCGLAAGLPGISFPVLLSRSAGVERRVLYRTRLVSLCHGYGYGFAARWNPLVCAGRWCVSWKYLPDDQCFRLFKCSSN